MRAILTWMLLAWLVLPVTGETSDPSILRILREEAEVNEGIRLLSQGGEAAQYGPFYCNKLVVNQHERPWPAVGIHQHVYHFYYDREEGDDEPRVWPDRLRKAVVEVRVSARSWRLEYLYGRRGELMLYRRQTQDEVLQLAFVQGRRLGPPAPPGAEREALRGAAALRKLFLDSVAVPLPLD